ncbi:MAG: methyltransferase domain-containing protein [Eubacteriaceae bacterium]
MNEFYIKKFENEDRIKELNPRHTLKKADFKKGCSLADIGAGTGIFSFAAAKISKNHIYAFDVSDEMIEILNLRKKERKAHNIVIKKVTSPSLPQSDKSCDCAVMCTVLHHIEDKEFMLKEIHRILKQSGVFICIDFHKSKTPSGPPEKFRMSEEEIIELSTKAGFSVIDKYSMGENFNCLIFRQCN